MGEGGLGWRMEQMNPLSYYLTPVNIKIDKNYSERMHSVSRLHFLLLSMRLETYEKSGEEDTEIGMRSLHLVEERGEELSAVFPKRDLEKEWQAHSPCSGWS